MRVHRDLAMQAGLSVGQIGEAVRTALQGCKIGIFRSEGEEISIRLVGPPTLPAEPEALLDLPLEVPAGSERDAPPAPTGLGGTRAGAGASGAPGRAPRVVTLRQVAILETGDGEEKIRHQRQMRQGSVAANYAGRPLGAVMADVKAALADLPLPEGYHLEHSGSYEDLVAVMRQLWWVFAVGLLLVYMVLASQFESFLDPFCLLFTVPLAAIGMVLALWVTGETFNISSAVGLPILMGIVVNNAIVLIGFVQQRQREGLPLREALLEASTARLRPILMTSLTTVLGLVPLALGLGEGTEFQQPMAIAIIGGLSFATLLTLVVIPCMYLLFNERKAAPTG